VQFILRHDRQKQFLFTVMQSATGQQLLARHGLNPQNPLSFLLVDESGGYVDTDAIIRIITRLGGTWKLASVFRIVPPFIRDPIYRLIARNRYHWFGKHDSCMVPDAEIANRFIQ
jgi:predicted DCC family thiol-disulfide oxidoreductase YuxK